MIPCIESLLSSVGTSWTVIVTILVVIGILLVAATAYFMCSSSGIRSQAEREREYGDWLRKQVDALDGDHWDGGG